MKKDGRKRGCYHHHLGLAPHDGFNNNNETKGAQGDYSLSWILFGGSSSEIVELIFVAFCRYIIIIIMILLNTFSFDKKYS